MNKLFNYLLVIFIGLTMFACNDDPIYDDFHSRVEKFDTHKMSIFRLKHNMGYKVEAETCIVELIQVDGYCVGSFTAKIEEISKHESDVSIKIPIDNDIENGTYVMRFDYNSIPDRYVVQIVDEEIVSHIKNNFNVSGINLKNDGLGIKSNPVKVADTDGLNQLLRNLRDDVYHGAGYYFKQTTNLLWKNDESVDGEGLSSQIFAGVYDGGNFSIKNIQINGRGNSGIFTTLTNGCQINNLKIDGQILNGSNYGFIAGNSEYTVKLDGITITGQISGEENIGGLIGSAKGKLSIHNSNICSTISGLSNIGGCVGYISDNCHLSISSISVDEHFIVGDLSNSHLEATNVGGIVGNVNNASFSISNSTIFHSTTKNDNTIVVSGDSNIGGIIGKITNLSAKSYIENDTVNIPILVNNYGGGFIGYSEISDSLKILNSQFSGIFKQGNYIGGAVGYIKTTGKDLFTYSNNKIVQNGGDCDISGGNYVGGIAGYIASPEVEFTGKNYVKTSISGADYVGGVVGAMENTSLALSKIYSTTTENDKKGYDVSGKSYVGGIVGYMKNSSLSDTLSFAPTKKINKVDSIELTIRCSVEGNGNRVGGAVGEATQSHIAGIAVNSTVTNSAGIYTGGIVGLFDNGKTSVSDCCFIGEITGRDYTGGIVGEINKAGKIINCINYAQINCEEYQNIGGIVGKANNKEDEPYIANNANIGDVKGRHFVGGIVGFVSADGNEAKNWTTVEYCGNYGTITASSGGGGCVGGIIGKCDSDKIRVYYSANNGSIIGNGSFKGIGGIAGSLGKDGILNELDNVDVYSCANTGAIISDRSGSANMGGIVGYLEEGDEGNNDHNSQVQVCYNCGTVGPAREATHGGMIGHCDYYTSLRYCINYGDTGDKGEAMIGTVVTSGIVHDEALYHLDGTGDDNGHSWKSTKFTEDEMGNLDTFSDFTSGIKEKWIVGYQLNMGEGESDLKRVILANCPFQNIKK